MALFPSPDTAREAAAQRAAARAERRADRRNLATGVTWVVAGLTLLASEAAILFELPAPEKVFASGADAVLVGLLTAATLRLINGKRK